MEIKAYITPLLKYWWLLALATVVAMISSFIVTSQQPPVYQARTTMVIGRAVYEANPNSADFYLNQQLASFYADLANRGPIRSATMSNLGIEWLPEYIVRPLPNSQLIEIAVTDTSPIRAQAVANELANQLILQTPGNPDQQDEERRIFIEEQLQSLEESISETQDEIQQKQSELEDLTSARQIADTQQEILLLESKLTTLQTNYSNLLANTTEGARNTLTIIEPASLPSSPVGPDRLMIILLSSIIAFTIAAGAAYLLDYLDDTFSSSEQITSILKLPVIGVIANVGNNNHGIYVNEEPNSPVAESFRVLRSNLEFANIDNPLKIILVSSSGVGDGKSFVAVNLAMIFALAGKKVLLMDADMRKPKIHQYLGISNDNGLSDFFLGNKDFYSVFSSSPDGKIGVITAGNPPPNPAEIMVSKKMDLLLENIRKLTDIVIIDGPPLLLADSITLSKKVDGTLLVIRYGISRRGATTSAMKQLNHSGANVLGVVFNNAPINREGYSGWYNYYKEYSADLSSSNGNPTPHTSIKEQLQLSFIKKLIKPSEEEKKS